MNPIDKFARAMRPAFIAMAYLTIPLSTLGFGFMAVLAMKSWPVWVVAPVLVSFAITALGLSSLIDARQEQN